MAVVFGAASAKTSPKRRVIEIGYSSCPHGAVKCGPPHFVEVKSRSITLRHRGKLRITASDLVSNHDHSQRAAVLMEVLMGSALVCAPAEIRVTDHHPRTISCRAITGQLTAGRHRIGIFERATGVKTETVRVNASDPRIAWKTEGHASSSLTQHRRSRRARHSRRRSGHLPSRSTAATGSNRRL
jgi:hypothetical protein